MLFKFVYWIIYEMESSKFYFTLHLLRYFAKKVSSTLRSVRKGLQTVHKPSCTVREGSFALYVTTNFKLRARMGCIIIYYVTCTQIANLLCKSPVREPVHKPFHAPLVHTLSCFINLCTYLGTYMQA